MHVTRRDFVKLSAGAATGTALGGLAGLGASLAPTLARAHGYRRPDRAPVDLRARVVAR